jgi:hypothetical protein
MKQYKNRLDGKAYRPRRRGKVGNYMSHKCIDFRIKKKLLRGNKDVMECKSCGNIKLKDSPPPSYNSLPW